MRGSYTRHSYTELSAVERIIAESGVYRALRLWEMSGKLAVTKRGLLQDANELDEHLAFICGYTNLDDMAMNWREETEQVFDMLAGEHGWTVYKMLLAKRGVDGV